MANKLDSTSLFLAQVNQHTDVLGNLLAGVTHDEIDHKLLNHCIVGTGMLANSASLMELEEWQTALEAYATLLKTYLKNGLPWDERIAQITSEFIEREDELVASAALGDVEDFGETVCVEGLQALANEVGELLEYASEAIADPVSELMADGSDDGVEPGTAPRARESGDGPELPPADERFLREEPVSLDRSVPADERATPGNQEPADALEPEAPAGADETAQPDVCLSELRRHVERLTAGRSPLSRGLGDLTDDERDAIRQDLCLVNFYASSMEAVLGKTRHGGSTAEIMGTLVPVQYAVRDVAAELCAGTDRRISVSVTGEDNSIDLRLLKPIREILHRLIEDIALRCDQPELHIDITVTNEDGALCWTLRDNGDNFVNDSRLDPDECLAFYPGLRQVRKILYKFRSLLWVEPDENGATRFAFKTPLSFESNWFRVWKNDGHSVAVLPNQLGDVKDVADVEMGNDARGEFLTINGRRVSILRLGQIYTGAPTDGDRIAVVGFLEKRIAFYVEGEEGLERGEWRRNAVSAWRGMQEGMVEIGGESIPLVDANDLLNRYLTIVDVASAGGAAGGVDDDVMIPGGGGGMPQTEINDHASLHEEETDVLVVEQSEVLRSSIAAILSGQRIRTRFFDQLEAALDFLDRGRASLIISDFRVPSMAAKALAEEIKKRGQDTPVLVTTTHSGENAEVLVRRLGVAGYISKPLQSEDVVSRVGEFLGSPRAPESRS